MATTDATDSQKIQTLIKRAYNVPSTHHDTPWYNETSGLYQTTLEANDINVQTPPEIPSWESESNLSNLAITADDFADLDNVVDFIETIVVDSNDSNSDTYSKIVQKAPGAYLDETETVQLFVRLKLDKMTTTDTTVADHYGVSTDAIAYVKYEMDSSDSSIITDNAFQFNYNTQLNVSDEIPVLKPYNYTLEYKDSSGSFHQVINSTGNWAFDFKSGIITFEEDPIVTGDLYFTFVKYVGLRGVNNLAELKGDLTVSRHLTVNPTTMNENGANGYNYYADRRFQGYTHFYNATLEDYSSTSPTSPTVSITHDNYYQGNYFSIGTNTSTDNGNPNTFGDVFVVDKNGNVGIGAAADQSKTNSLFVNGDAEIKGTLTFGSAEFDTDVTIGGDLTATRDAKVTGHLYVGENDSAVDGTTAKIFFGGGSGDYADGMATIEVRNYTNSYNSTLGKNDTTEMLLFKGNDIYNPSNIDRIRLVSGELWFDVGNNSDTAISSTEATDATDTNELLIDTATINALKITRGGAVEIADTLSVGSLEVGSVEITGNSSNLTIDGALTATGDAKVTGHLYVGENDSAVDDTTAKIFFGGGSGDYAYGMATIEVRNYTNSHDSNDGKNDTTEMLLFKGNDFHNDINIDRIRLVSGELWFDVGDNSSTAINSTEATSNGELLIDTATITALKITRGGVVEIAERLEVGSVDASYEYDDDDNSNTSGDVIDTTHLEEIPLVVGVLTTPINFVYRARYGTGGENLTVQGTQKSTSGDPTVSAFFASSVIISDVIYIFSDRRIKTNVNSIQDDKALIDFRKLNPCYYEYIDTYKKGTSTVYGFIAQEVNEVLPTACSIGTNNVPNVFSYADISGNLLIIENGTFENLELDLKDKSGNKIETITIGLESKKGIIHNFTVKEIINNNTIELFSNLLTLDSASDLCVYDEDSGKYKVFVYGQLVNNFHRLDKNTIWTVAAAALQEVDRQLVAEKEKTATLETEVSTLKTQMSDLLARVSSLENVSA